MQIRPAGVVLKSPSGESITRDGITFTYSKHATGIVALHIMTAVKKSRKMDPKLVAASQKSEISYIAKRHKVPVAVVRGAVKEAGRSRAKVYEALRKLGYTIKTRNHA